LENCTRTFVVSMCLGAGPQLLRCLLRHVDLNALSGDPRQVLTAELPALVASISFAKSMRWSSDVAYSRPMRWLLAMHGSTVLPFVHAGLLAGSTTRVLRNAPQPERQVRSSGRPMCCGPR